MSIGKQYRFSSKEWCGVHETELSAFIRHLNAWNKRNGHPRIVLREEIRRAFRQFIEEFPEPEGRRLRDSLGSCIDRSEEILFIGDETCFVLRQQAGHREAFLVQAEGRSDSQIELLDERRYLSLREGMILERDVPVQFMFGIDFRPFRVIPIESGAQEDIGKGPERITGMLQEEIQSDPKTMLLRVMDYLAGRSLDGEALFFAERFDNLNLFRRRLNRARNLLAESPDDMKIEDLRDDLARLGFARGWGRRVDRARENLDLLANLFDMADPDAVQILFERLPLLRRVLLVSVHGWFAQADVLGRPDTGGQVVYLLDQARALERQLTASWREAGIMEVQPEVIILARLIPEAEGSTCDQRKERIAGTENSWILRVPFREEDGEILPNWISRFQVWPYLERFAHEAYFKVMSEFGSAAPDLVVGNYSDGNFVASVLGREWGAPIAVIAHALEKMKYLLSDLYWRDLEQDYHFSIHFLSDILASNSADFIQVSSFQEIAGTPGVMGQYESYELFTLPGCYRVISGLNIHSARFVINPPGTDTEVYHPYTEHRAEDEAVEAEIESLVYDGTDPDSGVVGHLADRDKPVIFSMARLDKIKNMSGLVESFAASKSLREAYNLLIVSGETRLDRSEDHEEREQIQRMHELLDQERLRDSVCWIPAELGQGKFPHYYRFSARRRGIFVQPALFEAFGLTVLEAMACGLPVIATCFGGPAFVIEDGECGFLYDPNRALELEKTALRFLTERTAEGEPLWDAISHAGLRRIHEHFSWPGHARRLALSFGLYGLWNHLFPERRQVRRVYVDSIHHLLFNKLVSESWPARSGETEAG